MLGGLGLTPTQPQRQQQQHQLTPPTACQQQVQYGTPQTYQPQQTSLSQSPLRISPPEEMQVADYQEPQQPLFTASMLDQLRRAEVRAPLLFGSQASAADGSSSSERLQEEVRRQLDVYLRGQQTEVTALRRTVEELTQERKSQQRLPGGAAQLQGGGLPEGAAQLQGGGLRRRHSFKVVDYQEVRHSFKVVDYEGAAQLQGGGLAGGAAQLQGGALSGGAAQLHGGLPGASWWTTGRCSTASGRTTGRCSTASWRITWWRK